MCTHAHTLGGHRVGPLPLSGPARSLPSQACWGPHAAGPHCVIPPSNPGAVSNTSTELVSWSAGLHVQVTGGLWGSRAPPLHVRERTRGLRLARSAAPVSVVSWLWRYVQASAERWRHRKCSGHCPLWPVLCPRSPAGSARKAGVDARGLD